MDWFRPAHPARRGKYSSSPTTSKKSICSRADDQTAPLPVRHFGMLLLPAPPADAQSGERPRRAPLRLPGSSLPRRAAALIRRRAGPPLPRRCGRQPRRRLALRGCPPRLRMCPRRPSQRNRPGIFRSPGSSDSRYRASSSMPARRARPGRPLERPARSRSGARHLAATRRTARRSARCRGRHDTQRRHVPAAPAAHGAGERDQGRPVSVHPRQRQPQSESARCRDVFPGLCPRSGGRADCGPRESGRQRDHEGTREPAGDHRSQQQAEGIARIRRYDSARHGEQSAASQRRCARPGG